MHIIFIQPCLQGKTESLQLVPATTKPYPNPELGASPPIQGSAELSPVLQHPRIAPGATHLSLFLVHFQGGILSLVLTSLRHPIFPVKPDCGHVSNPHPFSKGKRKHCQDYQN